MCAHNSRYEWSRLCNCGLNRTAVPINPLLLLLTFCNKVETTLHSRRRTSRDPPSINYRVTRPTHYSYFRLAPHTELLPPNATDFEARAPFIELQPQPYVPTKKASISAPQNTYLRVSALSFNGRWLQIPTAERWELLPYTAAIRSAT